MPDFEIDSQSELIAPALTGRVKALVASFERIGRESMRGLPFYNESLSVEAIGFDRFGDGWLGVLITPWFMNLMLVSDQPMVRVQHHAAHIAAIAAEHGIAGPLLGVALDGHGHGDDGAAWGGEIMLIEGESWQRLGHLSPLALPGGDRAARSPWRMGVAALHAHGQLDRAAETFAGIPAAAELARLMRNGLIVPMTTSAGRLFDAAAALLGVCLEQRYEGQAAAELEALVRLPHAVTGGYRIEGGVLDFKPLLAVLSAPGLSPREGAELFHGTFADGLADWIACFAAHGGGRVALGGGCMMNCVLTESLCARLSARGLAPLLARAVPPNDGGLSLGQAFVARHQISTVGKDA